MWLPEKYKKPNTSTYVQGVEVETDYMGMIPEGFDTIHLPEAEYLQFQGQPFCEEDYCEAIHTVQVFMDSYDPAYLGYRWDDENLRIQLEPRGGQKAERHSDCWVQTVQEKAPRLNVCSAQNSQIAEPCVCLEKAQRKTPHAVSADGC